MSDESAHHSKAAAGGLEVQVGGAGSFVRKAALAVDVAGKHDIGGQFGRERA